ncbi:neuropeptide Y receptor type 1-like [Centruroides vittatus]|uniref:neuropeptide Y receptor type 1-like n=1 Tax=Centruroides vittatus TaxID=120091 RepID=UPI00350F426B
MGYSLKGTMVYSFNGTEVYSQNGTELYLMNGTELTTQSSASNNLGIYEVPVAVVVLLSICYGTVSVLTVLGNLCVLWIVATSRRMQTVINFFIANLACADIIIGLFSIPFHFQAALLQHWALPSFMCAFCPFVQVLSVNVSIFTLTAIAIDRYRAIIKPLRAHTTKLRAKMTIVGIWAFAGAAGIPNLIAYRLEKKPIDSTINYTQYQCINSGISENAWKFYSYVLVSLQYFIPLCVISYAYCKMGIRLRNMRTPGNAEDNRDATVTRNKKKVSFLIYFKIYCIF